MQMLNLLQLLLQRPGDQQGAVLHRGALPACPLFFLLVLLLLLVS